MTEDQAKQILINAAQVAQSKGAFSLDDAAVVLQAIKTLVPKEEVKEVEVETIKED